MLHLHIMFLQNLLIGDLMPNAHTAILTHRLPSVFVYVLTGCLASLSKTHAASLRLRNYHHQRLIGWLVSSLCNLRQSSC